LEHQNVQYDPTKGILYGGPIPVGNWKIYSLGTHHPQTCRVHANWAPLMPMPGTKTFGRWGFYIHGKGVTTGCIMIPGDWSDFRDALNREKGGELTVTP